jgi:outer membrane biosynthesis protein TonB
MPSRRDITDHPTRRSESSSSAPRLANLRQVITDRRRANDRLRRSLWVSLLVHALIFLLYIPAALQGARDHRGEDLDRPELATSIQPVLLLAPPPPRAARSELPSPASDQAPPVRPLLRPDPEPDEADPQLEFVRSHLAPSEAPPLTDRISTQNQQVEHERVAHARSQIADGRAERGTRSGSPQDAAQAGARPQRASQPSRFPQQRDRQRNPEAQQDPREPSQGEAAAQPSPRQHDAPPCDGRSPGSDCDGLARLSPQAAPQPQRGRAGDWDARSPAQGEREGWEPLVSRLPGLVLDAEPFAPAALPDLASALAFEPATPGVDRVEREREPTPPSAQRVQAKRAPSPREATPAPPQRAREHVSEPAVLVHQGTPTQPQPALAFEIEPLELVRQEQERERESRASKRASGENRRDTPPGSARSSARSTAGSEAAAGGSVVSPREPPPTIDIQSALATRAHPLAGILQALDDQLRASWQLPFEVRSSGIVGTTGLEFTIDRWGRIDDVVVTRPSGHPQLDTLARGAVPERVDGFLLLMLSEAREAFPKRGLRVSYQFAYTDSPVAGIL